MQLMYCPRTRAFTALWMLEEVGEPYELVRVNVRAPEHPTEAYKKINPMGKVPGFVDGDCAMGETAAILLYVADRFPTTQLSPRPTDPNRGRFLQWLMFSATTLEPAMAEKHRGQTPNTVSSGWGDYDRALAALETALTGGPWLFGETFTAADLYVASTLTFGMNFGMIDKRPVFESVVHRATQRKAFLRATEIETQQAQAG